MGKPQFIGNISLVCISLFRVELHVDGDCSLGLLFNKSAPHSFEKVLYLVLNLLRESLSLRSVRPVWIFFLNHIIFILVCLTGSLLSN